jgi:two-component system alkaline phosphatase synthesis response regulator PhoP
MSDAAFSTLAGCKVLVVEDHPQSLELLRIYVESLEGVEVLSAKDGVSGVKLAETHHPDLILLDVMMPRMSGFEVCRRLKEHPATRDIVVLIVTALDTSADLERAIECGADEYLPKPFERAQLVDRVRRLLLLQKYKRASQRDLVQPPDPSDSGVTP